MRERSDIAGALVNRLREHLGLGVETSALDWDASFLDGEGFAFDGQPLDSFDLVDALTVLEEELRVRLIDGELQELDSINRLAAEVEVVVPAETIDLFCARWQ